MSEEYTIKTMAPLRSVEFPLSVSQTTEVEGSILPMPCEGSTTENRRSDSLCAGCMLTPPHQPSHSRGTAEPLRTLAPHPSALSKPLQMVTHVHRDGTRVDETDGVPVRRAASASAISVVGPRNFSAQEKKSLRPTIRNPVKSSGAATPAPHQSFHPNDVVPGSICPKGDSNSEESNSFQGPRNSMVPMSVRGSSSSNTTNTSNVRHRIDDKIGAVADYASFEMTPGLGTDSSSPAAVRSRLLSMSLVPQSEASRATGLQPAVPYPSGGGELSLAQEPPPVAEESSTIAKQRLAVAHPSRPSHQRPVTALAIHVLGTYRRVNEVFYRDLRVQNIQNRSVYNGGFDDEHGNYIPVIGEEIADRFIVHAELGRGSFGVVVRCADRARVCDVALKLIRNRPQFYNQAKIEVEILTMLNQRSMMCTQQTQLLEGPNTDALGSESPTCSIPNHNIVRLLKVFSWKGHPVLVFELLAFSLYDLLRQTNFNGVSLGLTRKFATQLLQTLSFLQSQPVPVLHCDLKPENILLRNPKRSGIKVVDFGSACMETRRLYTYIQSRFYRSPEVMLRLPYTTAIDLWSLGCLLVELHVGLPLFPGRSEPEQLYRIRNTLGEIPQHMIRASSKNSVHFVWNERTQTYVFSPQRNAEYRDLTIIPLAKVLGVYDGGPGGRRRGQPMHRTEDYLVFLDFVTHLLQVDPAKRPPPSQLLTHPYITGAPMLFPSIGVMIQPGSFTSAPPGPLTTQSHTSS